MKTTIFTYIFFLLFMHCSDASKKLLPLFGLGAGGSADGGISTSVSESATLKKIIIEPPRTEILADTHAEYTATAIYTDGTKQDVTSQVDWSTQDEALVKKDTSIGKSLKKGKSLDSGNESPSNSNSKKAVFKGLGQGSTKIKATLNGITGEGELVIKPADIARLEINQLDYVATNSTVNFQVIAILKDGSKQDITKSVVWSLSKESGGFLGNEGDSAGVFTALEDGNIEITANFNGIVVKTQTNVSRTRIQSIGIEGKETLVKGLSTQLRVTALYEDGSKADVTEQVNWLSEDKQVLSINNDSLKGMITGIEPGDAKIRASIQGKIISKAVTITAPKVVSVSLPDPPSIAAGYSLALKAYAEFDDNITREVTSEATWEVDDDSIAFVYNSKDAGKLQTFKTGSVKISATVNGITAHTNYSVKEAVLTGISVGTSLSIPKGLGTVLHATGIFSDGTKRDISNEKDLTWHSKGDSIQLKNTFSENGKILAEKVGISQVYAELNKISSEKIQVEVKPAILESVSIEPSNFSLPKGKHTTIKAIGIYSDKSTQDLTREVYWALDSDGNGEGDTLLGDISNSSVPGEISASIEKEGKGKVIASIKTDQGIIKADSPFEITKAVLESISVSSSEVPKGVMGELKVTGFFSDKTSRDLTSEAGYKATGGLTVSQTGKISTNLESLSPGTYTITTTVDKFSFDSTITVKPAILTSISLGPSINIPKGLSTSLHAIGIYSDNSKRDISSQVVWSGGIPVGNDEGSSGNILASTEGSYKIQASLDGITGTLGVNVSPAVLESISVEPPLANIPLGTSLSFQVIGKYTDGKRDITKDVSWILDSNGDRKNDEILGGVSNSDFPGLFQSTSLSSIGKGELIASIGLLSVSIPLEVRKAELVSISLSPSTVPSGVPGKFTAIGTYTDGSKKDITREVSFSNESGLWIDQETGLIQTNSLLGEYTITASHQTKTASTTLRVTEAVLVSLSIDAPGEIAKGLTTVLKATGLYSDGSKKDLSHLVTFHSDKPEYLSNSALNNGEFFAKTEGDLKISASYSGISSQPMIIKVAQAALVGLSIDQPKISIPKGTSHKFTVTGQYTDGKRDLSSQVFWELEMPSLGTIANSGISGLFTSNQSSATGSGRVIASIGGQKATAQLEIKEAELVSISLGSPQSLALGLDSSLKAIGTYTDGSTKEITSNVQWSVSGGLFINSQGVVSGSQKGEFTITASLGTIQVNLPLIIKEAELVGLSVTPALSSLAKGTSLQLRAVGVYTDGTTKDHTNDVYWNADPSKLIVANQNQKGLAQASGVGITTVTASLLGKQGMAAFTITPAELVSISLGTPQSTADGLPASIKAIGIYTDGSTQDITSLVNWSVQGKATISNGLLGGGIVSPSGEETATIRATFGSISGSTTLTVTPAELVSLVLSPNKDSLAKGLTSQISATGYLTNGKTVDLSSQVTWKADSNGDGIDDSLVVSVSNLPESKGAISTTGVGTASITATANGKTSSYTITVTKAELVSISVSPANPSIAKGLSQQFRATGFYTDNSTQDLTQTVSWMAGELSGGNTIQFSPLPSALTGSAGTSVSPTGIASISNAQGSKGLLTALNPGSTSVYASTDGKSGYVNISVGQAVLTGISITSNNTDRPKGLSEQFTATGVYSDGSTQDLSSQVTWKADSNGDGIDDANVVQVSNQNGTRGLVTSIGVGTATVTGTINGISSSKIFSVSPATVVSIEFQNTNGTPTSTGSVAAGLTDSIKAIATYTDNTVQDVSSSITWIADSNGDGKADNLVATVDQNGTVKTLAPGTVQIIGTVNGVSSTKTITVQSPSLTKIEVTPSTGSIAQGFTQGFTATGTYTDGSKQNMTSVVAWKADSNGDGNDDSSVASISNAIEPGKALGIQQGSVTITASYNNLSASANLSITPGITSTTTIGSYDLTLPSGLSSPTQPGGSFSGIVYTGGAGLSGFVSTIPDYGAKTADTLGSTIIGKVINDDPNLITNTSIISSNTVNMSNGGTVVYDMTLTTASPQKPTDVSNHLIREIGTNVVNGSVSNLPLPQGSETTSTEFRAIVQVTYNQFGSEMVGVGVTTSTGFSTNQAIVSSFLNGSNLIVTGTTLVDRTDSFVGAADPKVDFVWVVDNSGSMSEEQSSVINNSVRFFNILNGKHLDFRLGVIATGHTNSCAADGNAYRLWGTGWSTLANGADIFKSNVASVRLNGCGSETGVHWAKVALERGTVVPRSGAKLVFVLLSDEGDYFETFNGGAKFNTTSNIFTQNGHRWYSIIGLNSTTGLPGTCVSRNSSGVKVTSAETSNNTDPTYFDLARATGGSSSSICNTDYSQILENIATQSAAASSSYTLARKPLSSSIIVKNNGVTVTQDANNGWMYNSSSNSIVFSGSAWPNPGSRIEVIYKFDSSVAWSELLKKFYAYVKTGLEKII